MIEKTIVPIKAFNDNYIWCLRNGKHALVVDPGDANPVLDYLAQEELNLVAILITHHHPDHVGGNRTLLSKFNVPIYGPKKENIPGISQKLSEGDSVFIKELEQGFKIIEIPGHTLGHIGYYDDSLLLCGDTLFSCGCGRLFEGTPEQMFHSLQKIANLPDHTLIFCTHEYTEANIEFALSVEPQNKELMEFKDKVLDLRSKGLPSLPVSLRQEKLTNPFLRAHLPSVAKSTLIEKQSGRTNPIEVFTYLRKWKDSF